MKFEDLVKRAKSIAANPYEWILENLPLYFLIVFGLPLLARLVGWDIVPYGQYTLIAFAAIPPIAQW